MIMEHSLWYNSHVRIGNNVAYDMKLYTSGITWVRDKMVGNRLIIWGAYFQIWQQV